MLWTLWRAILIDFARLLLLSTAALVTVIAFAATIKPLADGKLTADQAIRFMIYAIPPMLAYALPFAAGFSATLTYHRLQSENEITAAKAGGIGYPRLLAPALAAGILLSAGHWYLSDRVIPVFLTKMENMVTRDFARIMVQSLRQGEAASIGNTEIHADIVEQVDPAEGSPTEQQFLLGGVAMIELDGDNRVILDGTAQRAWILLMPVWALGEEDRARIGDDDATAVVMKFINLNVHRDGSPVTVDEATAPAIPIPTIFEDDPKFLSGDELHEIAADPDRMSFVDRRRKSLARVVAAYQIFRSLGRDLNAGRPIVMATAGQGQIQLLGGHLVPDGGVWRVTPQPETGAVEIEVSTSDGRVQRLQAQSAVMSRQTAVENDPLASRENAGASRFLLELEGIRVLGAAEDDTGTELARAEYTDLAPLNDPAPGLLRSTSAELLAIAEPSRVEGEPGYNEVVANTAGGLEYEIAHLKREILSKRHERMAFAASCVVMVLAGAIIALTLDSASPLVVYLWSFFPGLGTLILLESGQEATHDAGAIGLPLLWAGVVLLGVYAAWCYRRVCVR